MKTMPSLRHETARSHRDLGVSAPKVHAGAICAKSRWRTRHLQSTGGIQNRKYHLPVSFGVAGTTAVERRGMRYVHMEVGHAAQNVYL
jgi:hypothetical protein